jgi:hypothetical protein
MTYFFITEMFLSNKEKVEVKRLSNFMTSLKEAYELFEKTRNGFTLGPPTQPQPRVVGLLATEMPQSFPSLVDVKLGDTAQVLEKEPIY